MLAAVQGCDAGAGAGGAEATGHRPGQARQHAASVRLCGPCQGSQRRSLTCSRSASKVMTMGMLPYAQPWSMRPARTHGTQRLTECPPRAPPLPSPLLVHLPCRAHGLHMVRRALQLQLSRPPAETSQAVGHMRCGALARLRRSPHLLGVVTSPRNASSISPRVVSLRS